ncbi:GCN5-related N-acetyltransferase [Coriobacterium glomerans PW2]|uniref:GCN5-related N-acetyltransferase n=1 Tax=Coriobacterium glomerans (strain ATCC 49209 / DSM 20642 / JCM 10262 / PW2) TaxID=700015 RepID=F2NB87_CORGP|nr:GNAT family N-acetyltransferase [Coriobacterium glomerans]AEB06623.1 GCN5-related N-acetyltransferase [Coriobacterium glomerans PW2]
MSRLLYRSFEEADFDRIAEILRALWHEDACGRPFGSLEASHELAVHLSHSTFSQTVLVDDVPIGLVLARSGHERTAQMRAWEQRCEDYLKKMAELDSRAQASYQMKLRAERHVNAELLKASGVSDDFEVTLLIVGGSAHHRGIGSVLLDAALSYLFSQGAPSAFLYTDSCCSWGFYDRCGLKRMATHRATREERKLLPREMYLYEYKRSD